MNEARAMVPAQAGAVTLSHVPRPEGSKQMTTDVAAAGFDPARSPDLQPVYDLIIETCEHSPNHERGAAALRLINRIEAENAGLRITLWNTLRAAGVGQELALQIIRDAACDSDTRRMAETGTGSVRSTGSAGRNGIAPTLSSEPSS